MMKNKLKKSEPILFLHSILVQILNEWKGFQLKKQYRLKGLEDLKIEQHKKSNTLFVLGTGSSINDINDNGWQHISSHDSLGLNFWCLHEFIPTFFSFELAKSSSKTKALSVLFDILKIKQEDYAKVPIILRNLPLGSEVIKLLPNGYLKNIYVPTTFSVYGSNKVTFKSMMKFVSLLKIIRIKNLLLYKRASISQALSFAAKYNYTNVVLVGIDLLDNKHFYDDEKYTKSSLPIPPKLQTGDLHFTGDPKINPITTQVIVEVFNETILNNQKIKLWVVGSKTLLYPMLPVWPFFEKASS